MSGIICGRRASIVDVRDCEACDHLRERSCQDHPTPSDLYDALDARLRALNGQIKFKPE